MSADSAKTKNALEEGIFLDEKEANDYLDIRFEVVRDSLVSEDHLCSSSTHARNLTTIGR
jgi:hypothetical protein